MMMPVKPLSGSETWRLLCLLMTCFSLTFETCASYCVLLALSTQPFTAKDNCIKETSLGGPGFAMREAANDFVLDSIRCAAAF